MDGAAAERGLPGCQVVIITALTLINHTIDHLLQLSGDAAVALVGPSTPMLPLLGERGVSHLFGMEVVDVDRTLAVVSQGGGTRRLKGATRKVHLGLNLG